MQSDQLNKQLLTEVSQAFLHHLSKGTKTLQKSGKLRLFKLSETEFDISLQDFVFSFNTETGLFFKTTNGTYSSYFFTPDRENLYAITVDKYQGSTEFETQINKLTQVFSYQKAKNYQLFQKLVEQNYPNPNIPLFQGNKVNRYIEKAGGILGESFKIMGGWSASAVNYIGQFVQSKVAPGEMSDQNRRKVDAVTEKSKAVSDVVVGAATTISKPIAQTGADLGTKLSSTLQSSQHASVRRMNDIGATSIQATGTAWKGFWDGLCTFSDALKTQSTNIWNKKFNSPTIPQSTTIKTQEQNLIVQN